MLTCAHKAKLTDLARRHQADLRDALRLARVHFSPEHMSVRTLTQRVEDADALVQAIEHEPARQVA